MSVLQDRLELIASAQAAIRAHEAELVDLSRRIHAHPELGFEEVLAAGWVAEALAQAGFDVERGICDLPTALRARAGRGALVVTFCAEYDALPGIGHACGHNLIAASSVGAAIGLARVAAEADVTVEVLGTPAEEVGNGGGKVLLLERGAFDDSHLAMMVHPAPVDVIEPRLVAAATFEVHDTGRAAHAGGFPELGVNAADAITVAQTAIGLLRQHLMPTDRVHGIVTRGGDAPNIVPAETAATYTIRAETLEALEALRLRVLRCFEAGALATGARLTVSGGDRPYAEVVHDREIAAMYRLHAGQLGRTLVDRGSLVERPLASTDMGNVSRVVPSIHPLIGINPGTAGNHQPEFAAACVMPDAERAMLDGALALAATAIEAATTPEVRERLLSRRGRGQR
jgi:amidohydrolase